MSRYGVFISHKGEDWALAGRIYDFLSARGLCPYLDANSSPQGNYIKELKEKVEETPYFLLLLTPSVLLAEKKKSVLLQEICWAEESNRQFLVLVTENFDWSTLAAKRIKNRGLCKKIQEIHDKHNEDTLSRKNFLEEMQKFVNQNIDVAYLRDVVDWQKKATGLARTYVASREEVEREVATLENRFGEELVACAKEGRPFEGKHHVRSIKMSCYAASLLFAPQINMVDNRAFDRGIMSRIIEELLRDDEFSLEIIVTAPQSDAAKEAASSGKLGNDALETYPEAIFLVTYYKIKQLVEQNEVFKQAKQQHRFTFMVTERALPYSFFQVEYKETYSYNDHIKVELYSANITSNMERRCMLFFKELDPENYRFFENGYKQMRREQNVSRELTEKNEQAWLQAWDEIKDKVKYEQE